MPNIGPSTLQKIKAIVERIDAVSTMAEIEDLGRRMGIPEDKQFLVCKIVEIEVNQRVVDEISALRAENESRHQERAAKEKNKFDWGRAIVNTLAGFVGDYNARNKK